MSQVFEDDIYLKGWATIGCVAADGTVTTLIDSNGVPTPTGAASVTTLAASGNVAVNTDKFTITAASGNTAIAWTLAVTWATTISWALAANAGITVDSTAFTVANTSWNVATAGTLSAAGNFAVNTDKFTVAAASGNTVVAGTLWVTWAVTHTSTTLCSDSVTIASGKSIIWAGTGTNGIVLKNLKNAAAGSLSWTALNVEIDIGWTPYYFAVYPTKS